jgi:hypothetical protein
MKTDKYNKLLDEVFQNEKSKKMDWSFDDFIAQTSKNKPKKSISFRKITYWAAAASVLLIIGIGFYFNNKPNINNDFIAEVKSENIIEQNIAEEKSDTPIVEKEETSINLAQKNTKHENTQNIENEYNSEYVTVNGKPVYDKQEADSIAIQALTLLAQNIEQSKEIIETSNQNIKQNINSINNLITKALQL